METNGTRRAALRSDSPSVDRLTGRSTDQPAPTPAPRAGDRAQAPIRWPHPSRGSLAVFGVWAVGAVVALFVPAFIVGPGEQAASTSAVWTAFSMTVLGAVIMIAALAVLWRRTKDSGALVLGCVPAIAVVAGGVILTASKLTVF